MLLEPFYNPRKTYYENFKEGPFGAFANGEILINKGEPKHELFRQKVFSPFGNPSYDPYLAKEIKNIQL